MFVHDLNGKRLCSLQDSRLPQDGAAQGIKVKKEIGGWKELSFNLSKNNSRGEQNFRCDYIKNEHLLYVTEGDETDIYCIKSPSGLHDKSKVQFTVTCNHISEDLKTKNLYKYFDDTNGIGTCEELISKAIAGSGWKLVGCDKFIESDGVTEKIRSFICESKRGAYNMIADICELFDARPIFHGLDRTIEIRAISNTTGWMEILFGKNMDKIKRTPNSDNIVTRLYVEGEYGDFGQVGIDAINPTGLPFILNFDYYKELGVFTEEHQRLVDQYLIDYKKATGDLQALMAELLELQAELSNLVGIFSYSYFSIINGEIDFANPILGNAISEDNGNIKTGDTIIVVKPDGSYEYKEYSNSDSFDEFNCVIKFVPTFTGMLAAQEDTIKASNRAIDSYMEKLNHYLRMGKYPEINSVTELKAAYGTNDLSIVKDEAFDLSGVEEQYRLSSVLEYTVSIGQEEKSISEFTNKKNEAMLRVCELIVEIDRQEEVIQTGSNVQTEVEDAFSAAMGLLLKDGYWSDSNYTIGQEESLQNDAVEISNKLAYPTLTYSIETHNLAVIKKYEGEEFELAQTVRIYDPELRINDHGVVAEITTHPDKPTSDSIVIKTDLLDIGSKSFSSILERVTSLAEQVRQNKGIYERAVVISKDGTIRSEILNGAIDVAKTQLLSGASNWKTDENGNIIFTTLDGLSAMMLCGSGFMIANSKTKDGEWNWRTFGTGNGFTADLIVAGFISADRIAAESITVNKLAPDVGKSLDLTGNESIRLSVEKTVTEQIGYRLEIISTSDILSSAITTTTMSVRVFQGKNDITDDIPDQRFRWKRISSDSTADTIWNNNHIGMKSITLTTLDVFYSATYQCEMEE